MEPIHLASWEGDVRGVVRLAEEDLQRLAVPVVGDVMLVPNDATADDDDDDDEVNVDGCTPLMLATMQGHGGVVERLLELGADARQKDPDDGFTAAHVACTYDRAAILARLLDAGTDINACDNDGNTLLLMAADSDANACMAVLVGREGIDLDRKDCMGNAALHCLVRPFMPVASFWAIQQLVEAGADPHLRGGYDNKTVLEMLCHMWSSSQRWNRAITKCKAMLKDAMAAPERTEILMRTRAITDCARALYKPPPRAKAAQSKTIFLLLKTREAEGRALPLASVDGGQGQEMLLGVIRCLVGLESYESTGTSVPALDTVKELQYYLQPRWDAPG